MRIRVDPKRTNDDLPVDFDLGFDRRQGSALKARGRPHPRTGMDDIAFLFEASDQEEEEFEDPDEWFLGHTKKVGG